MNNICFPMAYLIYLDKILDKNVCTVKTQGILKDGCVFSTFKKGAYEVVNALDNLNKNNLWIIITDDATISKNIPEYSTAVKLNQFSLLGMSPNCFIGEKSEYAVLHNDNYFHWQNKRSYDEPYLKIINDGIWRQTKIRRINLYTMEVYYIG